MHWWAPIWLTADNPLIQGPVEVRALVVTPDAGAVGDVTLRHGLDTSAPTAGTFRTGSGISLPVDFGGPVLFDRGFMVDVGSNVTGVLVIWRPCGPAPAAAAEPAA